MCAFRLFTLINEYFLFKSNNLKFCMTIFAVCIKYHLVDVQYHREMHKSYLFLYTYLEINFYFQ